MSKDKYNKTEIEFSNDGGTTKGGKVKGSTKQNVEANKRKVYAKVDEKEQRIRDYRKEASRLASLANKRIKRLEKNDLTNSPAFKAYIENGGGKFSVKGKTFNELQSEVARMNKFINAQTSTVKGINNYLKELATNTGIKYNSLKELQAKSEKFFELSAKVEEYIRTVNDMASAIGYQKIWQAVNKYTQTAKIDLSNADLDVEDLIVKVSEALTEHQKPENLSFSNGKDGFNVWFKLPKE